MLGLLINSSKSTVRGVWIASVSNAFMRIPSSSSSSLAKSQFQVESPVNTRYSLLQYMPWWLPAAEKTIWNSISCTARRTLFTRKAFKSGANFGTAFAYYCIIGWSRFLKRDVPGHMHSVHGSASTPNENRQWNYRWKTPRRFDLCSQWHATPLSYQPYLTVQ